MPGEYSTESLAAHFETTNRRLDHIEQQLLLLAKTVGVPYATWAESQNVPDDVIELARAGKTLEAIARYRQLTGANLQQARSIVAGLARGLASTVPGQAHFSGCTFARSAVASGRAFTLLSKIATQLGPTTKTSFTDECVFRSSEQRAAFPFGICLVRAA